MRAAARGLVAALHGVVCAAWAGLAIAAPRAAEPPSPPAGGSAMTDCNVAAFAGMPAIEGAEVRVTAATRVPAGTSGAHCRIEGTVSRTIGFVLRVPEGWNRKLLMQGCRALCGYHATADCDDALARGYATLTTDTGHTGSLIDSTWARDDPQARADYAWRAVHLVALAGKDLVARARGERPTRTYLRGCSNGGRQGLLEAERFPETFDGVIAGAPLVPGDGVLHLAWSARANLDARGRPILTHDDLDVLHAIVQRQCGDAHGIVRDPERCRIDPHASNFGAGTAAAAWSREKREAVRRIYDGPHTRDGTALTAGGPLPGSELAWRSFVASAGEPSLFATLARDYLRNLAFDPPPRPDYALDEFDFDRDPPLVRAAARAGRATGDLRAFAARSGKVIVYHGWADESVVPGNTLAYARAVRERLGDAVAERAFRLYMLPGVGHCSEAPGAGRVDWLTALEDWVERGRAPGALAGHGFAPGRPGTPLEERHLPYPVSRSSPSRR